MLRGAQQALLAEFAGAVGPSEWRDDQITSRLRTKATEMVQKLNQGGKLADEAASPGLKTDTAAGFRRDTTLPSVPTSVIEAAFRSPKDSAAQAPGADGGGWIVFRVTDVTVPPLDPDNPKEW